MAYQSNFPLTELNAPTQAVTNKPSCLLLFELDFPAQAKLSRTPTMLLLTALLSADNSPPAANATDPSSIVRDFFFFPLQMGSIQKVVLGSFSLSSSPQQLVPLHHDIVSIVCNFCHLAHV
jgi:hypothetical protein